MIGAAVLSTIAQVASKVGEAAWARNSANHAYRQNVNSAQHAHQWETADLKAAGLNPILSANGGAAASSFLGQSPVIDMGEAAKAGAQTALAQSQEALQKSQAVLNYSNSANLIKQLDAIDQNIRESMQRQATGQAQMAHFQQQVAESLARSKIYGPQAKLFGAQAVNQLAMAGLNSAQATNVGMQNAFWQGNPDEYRKHMQYGTGNPYASAGQLGVDLAKLFGKGVDGVGRGIKLGADAIGAFLGGVGSGSSAQSVLDNSGQPF